MKKIIEAMKAVEWYPIIGIMAVIAMTITFLYYYL